MSARWKTTAVWAACCLLLAASGMVNSQLAGHRQSAPAQSSQARNRPPVTPSQGAAPPPPPAVLAMVLLGGFRGVFTDLLWIRAAMLQEQGRFVELVQLADWITALEPEYPQVWALQAWNMAYNISVLMPDEESRWQWVRNGLHLLRERGIPATGAAPAICLELGQLFQHKIGGWSDDHADLYLARWIAHVMQITGHRDKPVPSDYAALAEALRMDETLMRQIDQQYGRIDWRLPASQALYWAWRALAADPAPETAIRCRRMIYQAMATLFETGAVSVAPDAGVIALATAYDLLPGSIHAFEEAVSTDPVAPDAFAIFLRRAIFQLAVFNRKAKAEHCFGILHQRFPDVETHNGFEVFIRHAKPVMMPRIIPVKGTIR